MTRTRASSILVLAVIGAVLGFFLQTALAAASQPKFVPAYTIALSLVIVAALVIALAVPIRRATRGKVRRRIDPFHATRVVVIAKASSLAGGLLTGLAIGLLAELLVRSGGVNSDSLLKTLATLGGAVVLLVAGLVGEFLCTVPPPSDDEGRDLPVSLEP